MSCARARANANVALAKYWGKRDEALNLPLTGSLSVTLDGLETTASVRTAPVRAGAEPSRAVGPGASRLGLGGALDPRRLRRVAQGREERRQRLARRASGAGAALASRRRRGRHRRGAQEDRLARGDGDRGEAVAVLPGVARYARRRPVQHTRGDSPSRPDPRRRDGRA